MAWKNKCTACTVLASTGVSVTTSKVLITCDTTYKISLHNNNCGLRNIQHGVSTGHTHSTINETSSENQSVSATNVVGDCMEEPPESLLWRSDQSPFNWNLFSSTFHKVTFVFSTSPHEIWRILPWVPEHIFFLSILMIRGEASSTRCEASRGKNLGSLIKP